MLVLQLLPGPPCAHLLIPMGFLCLLHYLRLRNSLPQTAKSLVRPWKGSGISTDHKAAWKPVCAYSALQTLASFVCLCFFLISLPALCLLFIPAIRSASSAAHSGGHLHERLSARHSRGAVGICLPHTVCWLCRSPSCPGTLWERPPAQAHSCPMERDPCSPPRCCANTAGLGPGATRLVPRSLSPGSPRPTGRCSPVSSSDLAAAGHTKKFASPHEILNLSEGIRQPEREHTRSDSRLVTG